MVKRLTINQKIKKVKTAIDIISFSKTNGVSLAKASKQFKKDKRFLYDVHRRWIVKNPKGIPQEMINDIKSVFSPKILKYKKDNEE